MSMCGTDKRYKMWMSFVSVSNFSFLSKQWLVVEMTGFSLLHSKIAIIYGRLLREGTGVYRNTQTEMNRNVSAQS